MLDSQTIALEAAERDALFDLFEAAPADVHTAFGLSHRRIDDGVLVTARAVDMLDLNRLTGLGVAQPVQSDSLDAAIAAMQATGGKHWGVSIAEGAAALRALCVERGMSERPTVWAKFVRGLEPAAPRETPIAVREVGADQAEAFAETAAAGFGLPPPAARWLCALPGRLNWRCFVGFAGAAPVATGAFYLAPRGAWLGFGATLAEHRGKGAQPALLAARINAAREAGAALLTTETGIPAPGEAAPSFANIQRAGFRIAYRRPNMQRRG